MKCTSLIQQCKICSIHVLVQGVGKGIAAFMRSISLEALDLSAALSGAVESSLAHTQSILGSQPRKANSSRDSPLFGEADGQGLNQPHNASEGLSYSIEMTRNKYLWMWR